MTTEQKIKDNIDSFETLYSLYAEYIAHTNISAIKNKEEVFEKHFKDSLLLLDIQSLEKDSRVLDLGSGGGFPILPLAIVLPEVKFYALDATAKKTKFIEIVKNKLSLDNIEIITGRAEEFAHEEDFRESFDFVLARAVAKLNVLLELCSGFIKEKGSLCAYKAYPIRDEEKDSSKAQKQLSLEFKKRKQVTSDKQIIFFTKTAKLASKYPRQFAQIKTKPL